MNPKISDGLVQQEVDDELIIYNTSTHKAHNLNKTAKAVFEMCDGNHSFEEIRKKVFGKDPGGKTQLAFTLSDLQEKDLLQTKHEKISRREMIKRVGMASVIAFPIISSIVAPAASNAASVPGIAIPPGTDPFCLNTNCATGSTICTGGALTPYGCATTCVPVPGDPSKGHCIPI